VINIGKHLYAFVRDAYSTRWQRELLTYNIGHDLFHINPRRRLSGWINRVSIRSITNVTKLFSIACNSLNYAEDEKCETSHYSIFLDILSSALYDYRSCLIINLRPRVVFWNMTLKNIFNRSMKYVHTYVSYTYIYIYIYI